MFGGPKDGKKLRVYGATPVLLFPTQKFLEFLAPNSLRASSASAVYYRESEGRYVFKGIEDDDARS